ncbi:hypothetical protein ACF09H_40160 [Streptomyces sp. NPDC014983]|uniref:hypothetical protein n=1 Tax=Streptomyces sp. NPDC014983 TaxID=3364933 RepID=UPI0036FAB650
MAAVYGGYGLHALKPLSAASHLVSAPSLWAVFDHFAPEFLGPGPATASISALWPVLMLGLALALHRHVPSDAPDIITVTFALAFSWVLAAPWSMPWYTALACALAALFRSVRLTQWLVVTTAGLALLHNSGGHGWT